MEQEAMATQPPERPLPPSSLWDATPRSASRLTNEFLLVTVVHWLIVVAIGCFAPNVVDDFGRPFFYLLVVLAFVAYVFGRGLTAYAQLRQQVGLPEPKEPSPPPAGPS
jgi:hypothetical protein